MDLRLKEVTWVRLVSLLLWTLLMMVKKGATQLLELIESRTFDVSTPNGRERDQEGLSEEATLLPPLSDELVLSQIWPLLHQRVNVSLLWRLRRVNKAWKGRVGSSLEWAALEMVRVDSPGFMHYLAKNGENRPSLRDRVESEARSFELLLCERLSDFSAAPRLSLLKADDVELAETDREQGMVGFPAKEAAVSSMKTGSRACEWINYRGFDKFQERYRREYDWSEEEEIEAYSSSSEGSLRAYYPHCSMRV